MKKRIMYVIIALALITSVITPAATMGAADDYYIVYSDDDMVVATNPAGHWSSADNQTDALAHMNYMTASPGYASIKKWVASENGTFKLQNFSLFTDPNNANITYDVDFTLVDGAGKVLLGPYTMNASNKRVSALSLSLNVKAGDEISFVVSNATAPLSYIFMEGEVYLNDERVDTSGNMYGPNSTSVQGSNGWYFCYSTDFDTGNMISQDEFNILPLKIFDFTETLMTKSVNVPDHWTFDPTDSAYKSFVYRDYSIASPGYATIRKYVIQSDGAFEIKNFSIKTLNAPDDPGYTVNFVVVDQNGKVLLDPVELGTGKTSVTGLSMTIPGAKAGDEVNFVTYNASADMAYLFFAAEIYQDGARLFDDQQGNLYGTNSRDEQGNQGWYFTCSTDFKQRDILSSYDKNLYLTPYWEGTAVYHESVWVIENGQGAIEDISLLYHADSILSVRSADLKTIYKKDIDYTLVNGKLHVLPTGSIPVTTYNEYYPSAAGANTLNRTGGGYIYFSENSDIHLAQIAVTYTHSGKWEGYVPESMEKLLPGTLAKLKNKEELNIVFYGDDVAAGAGATSAMGADPMMPLWTKMFTDRLKEEYNYDDIRSVNSAMPGKSVQWGVENVTEKVINHHPDLVILAFGMNDDMLPADFAAKIEAIIHAVKQSNPDAEFAVVSPIPPNGEAAGIYNGNIEKYEEALLEIESKTTAVIRMTSVHQYLLENKGFAHMTSDNASRPNDFLTRAYAQAMIAAFMADGSSPQEPQNPDPDPTDPVPNPTEPEPDSKPTESGPDKRPVTDDDNPVTGYSPLNTITMMAALGISFCMVYVFKRKKAC